MVVRPLLPTPARLEGRAGQPEGYCHRQMLDAIRSLVAGGISWRSTPVDFPGWDRVCASWVSEDERDLPAAREASPAGTNAAAVTCEKTGEVFQGAAEPIDGGRVGKHEDSWRTGDLGRESSTRSLPHARHRGRRPDHPSGRKRFTTSRASQTAGHSHDLESPPNPERVSITQHPWPGHPPGCEDPSRTNDLWMEIR
ncbi:transposase [Streptomyces sp. NPDC053728]|uniref:transposase n=1 Tax=Streptomyces sp. NPDC053728 TaxID=3155534 RepID=UPI003442B66B